MQLWIPQTGRSGLSPHQSVLSPAGMAGLEIPRGENLAPAGPAMSPALAEEPVEKDMTRVKIQHIFLLMGYGTFNNGGTEKYSV